ncbi:MAG: hypothetical protein D6773_14840, partial [Alphaproteobacteria bacterium]
KLDQATVLLGIAVDIAQRYDLPLVVARLAIRAALVLSNVAEYERGLALAEWAMIRYSEADDAVGVGQAHYCRGLMLGYSGHHAAAIKAFHAALRYLPAEPVWFHGGAWQCIGFNHYMQGLTEDANAALPRCREDKKGWVDEAAHALTKATEILSAGAGQEALGNLAWIRARVAVVRDELRLADQLYAQALEHIADAGIWLDAALIAAERVGVLLELGKAVEARQFARGLTPLVIPLEDASPIAALALADLIRAALEGSKITHEMLEQVRAKICAWRGHAS